MLCIFFIDQLQQFKYLEESAEFVFISQIFNELHKKKKIIQSSDM
jgi:hypothetical protein